MMYIRRLYFLRKGMLASHRQAHLDSVSTNSGSKAVHPQQALGKLANVAQVLKQTALQDVQVYHNVGHALGWGVSSLLFSCADPFS